MWLSDFNLDYLLESDGDMSSDRERKLAEVDAVGELVDASGTRDIFGDAVDEMRAEIGQRGKTAKSTLRRRETSEGHEEND